MENAPFVLKKSEMPERRLSINKTNVTISNANNGISRIIGIGL